MRSLVIVESPTKARTLTPILGSDYTVRASMGHVRDLPEKELGVDITQGFKPKYYILRQKSKTIKLLREAVEQAGTIYLATDPDREGEAIAWHLLQVLKPGGKSIRRVTFHEITPSAIQAAFAEPRAGVDMNLVDAQQARRILDRLVGYQVSPILRKTKRGKSAGRVQSVALRLVVDREREIQNFKPQEYWSIHAHLAQQADEKQDFWARLIQIGNKKVGLDQLIQLGTKADADAIIAAVKDATYYVKSIKQEKRTRKPWPPFTTSTLQQSASARLGISPAEAMKIAQELYEGVDIGTGKPVGLITYMRTDSTAISVDAQQAARRMIEETLGKQYLPATAPTYKTKVKNAQEAHEAIRPTDVFRYPSTIRDHLTDRQYKVYDLIWRRFVASQMSPAVYDVTTVDVSALVELNQALALFARSEEKNEPAEFLFRAIGRVLLFDGFLRVWQDSDEPSEDEDEPQRLPALTIGEALDLLDLQARQHFTQPPPRYTEATLIKALEDRGIGRPSTYAAIMSTLKAREYVVLEKRRLMPTPLGETACDALVAAFPDQMDYGFTAQVEDWLDDISRGETHWTKALSDFYDPFSLALKDAEAKMRAVPQASHSTTADLTVDIPEEPSAQGKQQRSALKSTRKRKRSELITTVTRKLVEFPDIHCPKCGAPMVQRSGPRGQFLGCSRFPQCKGTRDMVTTLPSP